MTYIVSSGALNSTHSLTHSLKFDQQKSGRVGRFKQEFRSEIFPAASEWGYWCAVRFILTYY